MLEVLDYLPLESKGCLATCSSTMAKKLGIQYWFALQHVRKDRQGSFKEYLLLLLKDRPDNYYCYTCLTLHHVDYNISRPKCHYFDKPSTCYTDQEELRYINLGYLVSPIFTFTLAQNAMVRKRLPGAAEEGRVKWIHGKRDLKSKGLLKVWDVEARIDSDQLLLRTQHILVGKRNTKAPSGSRKWGLEYYLCHHCDWETAVPPLGGKVGARCKGCPTEIHIWRFQVTTGEEVLCVTQWMNLGPIISPQDRYWRAHAGKFNKQHQYFKEFSHGSYWLNDVPHSWIKNAFEKQEGVTYEQLTDAKVAKLLKLFLPFSGFFRKILHRIRSRLRRVLT